MGADPEYGKTYDALETGNQHTMTHGPYVVKIQHKGKAVKIHVKTKQEK